MVENAVVPGIHQLAQTGCCGVWAMALVLEQALVLASKAHVGFELDSKLSRGIWQH